MISGTNPHILTKRIIAYIFTLLVMSSIFYFSSQPATQSKKTSNSITKKIVSAITKNKKISNKKKANITKKLDEFVRKAAHFFLFLLLGASVFVSASFTFLKKGKSYILKTALYCLLFCVLYAVSDEIHQIYVPGRSCQFTDVLIDSAGSTIGILPLYFIRRKKAVN